MRGYRPGAPECRQSECDEGRNRADERRAASAGLSRRAADTLRSGLLSILDRHGEVHMVGSYVLGLMTSRDLDIHVVRADLDVRAFSDLGGEITRLLKPHRMHFRDESTAGTVCLTGSTGESTWVTNATVLGRATYGRRIVRRTSWCADSEMICQPSNDRNRAEILEIKAACWRYPLYRRGFHKRRCLCGRARSRRWRCPGILGGSLRYEGHRGTACLKQEALLIERGAIGRICRRVLEIVLNASSSEPSELTP